MHAATETSNGKRAQEYDANRRRAERGTVLGPLDAALLRYTGQYLHGATVPRRMPGAVDPALLPAVMQVIATAEQACAGMPIGRDPRRGKRATDKRDWERMAATVDAAVRCAHPGLVDDAVRTVSFLMCCADHRPVDPPCKVGLGLDRVQDPVPGAVRGPAAMPVIDGLPRAVTFRQVTPGDTGPNPEQDAVDRADLDAPRKQQHTVTHEPSNPPRPADTCRFRLDRCPHGLRPSRTAKESPTPWRGPQAEAGRSLSPAASATGRQQSRPRLRGRPTGLG